MNKIKFKISGESMLPIIQNGSLIEISMIKYSDLLPGDIVLFKGEKGMIVHRLLIKKKQEIVTKGDNSITLDKKTNKSKIIGKVIKIDNIKVKKNKRKFLFYLIYLFSLISNKLYYKTRNHPYLHHKTKRHIINLFSKLTKWTV